MSERVGRKMRGAERHQYIVDYLRAHRSVDVSFLSDRLQVSYVTIRKDLEKLERDKLLVRTHGGAMLNEQLFLEPSFLEKEDRAVGEKAGIAAEAARFVTDGMTIGLSSGTTIGHLAKQLKDRTGLTIVTNAINVAVDFIGTQDNHVFLTGGQVRNNTFALVGETAENALNGIFCEYCFIGTNGFTLEQGATTPSMEEARVVRKMMDNANHVVLLVDHSKFGKLAFHRIVSADRIDTVITDRLAPSDTVKRLGALGVRVIIA